MSNNGNLMDEFEEAFQVRTSGFASILNLTGLICF